MKHLSLSVNAIFGRYWLHKIYIDWNDIRKIGEVDYEVELQKLLKKL